MCFVFEVSFEDAKRYRDYFRAKAPINYNENAMQSKNGDNEDGLPFDAPPQIDQTITSDASTFYESNDSEADENEDNVSFNATLPINETAVSDESTLSNESHSNDYEVLSDTTIQSGQISPNVMPEIDETITPEIDIKRPLDNVQLNDQEASVFNHLFNNSSDNYAIANDEQLHVSPGGSKKVTKTIDDDCELSFDPAEFRKAFTPHQAGYQVKINDPLSGNAPFKENVRNQF